MYDLETKRKGRRRAKGCAAILSDFKRRVQLSSSPISDRRFFHRAANTTPRIRTGFTTVKDYISRTDVHFRFTPSNFIFYPIFPDDATRRVVASGRIISAEMLSQLFSFSTISSTLFSLSLFLSQTERTSLFVSECFVQFNNLTFSKVCPCQFL